MGCREREGRKSGTGMEEGGEKQLYTSNVPLAVAGLFQGGVRAMLLHARVPSVHPWREAR